MTNKDLQNLLKTHPEDIKVGDFVNLKLLVTGIVSPVVSIRKDYILTLELPSGSKYVLRECDFEALSPANGIKTAKTAPKYDPCRKFRKGDIVAPCQVKGRWQSTAWKGRSGILFTVMSDEKEDGIMWVKEPDSRGSDCVNCVYFQLVTPVEELEPYHVFFEGRFAHVRKGGRAVVSFKLNAHPHAKEAAEAERDRLNAEYRKEQSNG